jgi:hypothetical protein
LARSRHYIAITLSDLRCIMNNEYPDPRVSYSILSRRSVFAFLRSEIFAETRRNLGTFDLSEAVGSNPEEKKKENPTSLNCPDECAKDDGHKSASEMSSKTSPSARKRTR